LTILLGIFGAGGCGREVVDYASTQISEIEETHNRHVQLLLVDNAKSGMYFGEVKCISESEFVEIDAEKKYFNVAINNSKVREIVFNRLVATGAVPLNVVSDLSYVSPECSVGPGLLVSRFASINTSAKIGKAFHCNYYAYVSHDSVIGDFVTFAPGVMCNGNVRIENHVYIGAGAILRQGTESKPLVIGEGAVVGMGSVVTKDVPANTTVVGNPARVI
jgi:sugar O-acyltransferase (sialic acid O-acetyltransferase NeuD family)